MAAAPVVKVIYGKPMLPDLARVLACLYEKEIKFELEDMNKGKRMTQDIINLQISSHWHTPGLQDGTDEIFGSRKICKKIVDKYKEYGYQYLMGNDPLARVSVEQWIQSEEHMFDPPSSALVFYLAYKIEPDEENTIQSEKKLAKVLNLYEQRLGEVEFLAGNCFTLADLNHLPNTYYLESSDEYGYLFKDRKNVSRWWKNISNRDSWKNVIKKLDEEGLQFKNLESCSEIDRPSSPPNKKGLKTVPIEVSEIGGKEEKAKLDIPGNETALKSGKEDTNLSGEKSEPSFGKEKNEDGAVKSTPESKKDGSEFGNNKETSPSEEEKKTKATQAKTESKKDEVKLDVKDKSSSGDKKPDDSKERDVYKPDNEGKKDAHKSDKSNNQGKKDSALTDPVTEGKKDGLKSNDKDKAPSEKEKEADSNKQNKYLSMDEQIKQSMNSSAQPDTGTEGKKDGLKLDDKDKAPSGKEKEADPNKKKEYGGMVEPDKQNMIVSTPTDQGNEGKKDGLKPDVKDTTISGKENEPGPNKISKNGGIVNPDNQVKTGSTPPDPGTEGKKDGPKPDDKDKAPSEKEKEPDLIKKHKNHGTVELDNQVNKGSAPNDPGTESKRDGLKPDDKDNTPSRKEKENDLNKINGALGTDEPDNQGNRGSAATNVKDTVSSSDNKNLIRSDEKEKNK